MKKLVTPLLLLIAGCSSGGVQPAPEPEPEPPRPANSITFSEYRQEKLGANWFHVVDVKIVVENTTSDTVVQVEPFANVNPRPISPPGAVLQETLRVSVVYDEVSVRLVRFGSGVTVGEEAFVFPVGNT